MILLVYCWGSQILFLGSKHLIHSIFLRLRQKYETMSKVISSMFYWVQHVVGIIYWINYLHLICQISTTPKTHPKPWIPWQWPEHMSFVISEAHHISKSNIGYDTERFNNAHLGGKKRMNPWYETSLYSNYKWIYSHLRNAISKIHWSQKYEYL